MILKVDHVKISRFYPNITNKVLIFLFKIEGYWIISNSDLVLKWNMNDEWYSYKYYQTTILNIWICKVYNMIVFFLGITYSRTFKNLFHSQP